ncbi:MAG: GtrA family protein [Oscillospiraceae bacterium]
MADEMLKQDKKPDIFDRIMMKGFLKKLNPLYTKYKEMLLYCFFGALTTVVSFIALGIPEFIFTDIFGISKDIAVVPSNVISWICAVTFAYVTNRIWVFEHTAHGAKGIFAEAFSFYSGRFVTLVVETVMMWFGVSILDINMWIVKIIASIVVFILNYIISKVFIFRKR